MLLPALGLRLAATTVTRKGGDALLRGAGRRPFCRRVGRGPTAGREPRDDRRHHAQNAIFWQLTKQRSGGPMADEVERTESEGLIVKLDIKGPIELEELSTSLAALSRLYARHYGEPRDTADARAPRLYVTRLESGSLIAHLAPLVPVLGQIVEIMNTTIIVREFTRMLGEHIRVFSGRRTDDDKTPAKVPNREDTKDLREFLKPVTAQAEAKLNLKAAKFRKRGPDGAEVSVEYEFSSSEINMAALSMDRDLEDAQRLLAAPASDRHTTVREKLMYFEQASRGVVKNKGRTGDRAVIQDVSEKPIKVYFPEGAADIKRAILESSENPFSKAYIVDVAVQYVGEEPKVYNVIRLHDVVDLGD